MGIVKRSLQVCLAPTKKHNSSSVMIWAAKLQNSFSPLIVLQGRVKAKNYLGNLADYVHSMLQTSLPDDNTTFQDDDDDVPIHKANVIQYWYEQHKSKVGHLDWPLQTLDLKAIERV